MTSSGSTLRAAIDNNTPLICPGVHDPLTAGIADQVGFDALYMTGYGTSVSKIGYPDAGFITMPEMIENAKHIQEHIQVPLIADADNGYGNATNVVRTVREYIKAGVAGIHIEDQIFPKRCGHTKGRQVISKNEAVGKIRAAADVRAERNEDFVLIARTDARGTSNGSLTEAIDRVNAFLDAGADVAFLEGPTNADELRRVGAAVDGPLLYNFVGELGSSPYIELDQLSEWGYDIVIFPVISLLSTIASVHTDLSAFAEDPISAMERIDMRFDDAVSGDLHSVTGFSEVVNLEERYMPAEEQDKYDASLGDDVTDE